MRVEAPALLRTVGHIAARRAIIDLYKPKGRPFLPGFDPRRHRGPSKDSSLLRRDFINSIVICSPDALLDILEAWGLIPVLIDRYRRRRRRDPRLGGPKCKAAKTPSAALRRRREWAVAMRSR